MRTNAALMRNIQWQGRAHAGADANDLQAGSARPQPSGTAAGAAVIQPAATAMPNAATAAANRDANMEGMCAAELARRDERPLQPELEACEALPTEAGAPAAAGGAADEAAEEAAAVARVASSDACAAALGQPKVALMFLTPGPLPHADVRPPSPRRALLGPLLLLLRPDDARHPAHDLLCVPHVPHALQRIGVSRHELEERLARAQVWAAWLRASTGLLRADCLAGRVCGDANRGAALDRIRAACGNASVGAGAASQLFSVYVHPPPAFRGYPAGSIFRGREVPGRVKVKWGDYSVVEARPRRPAALLPGRSCEAPSAVCGHGERVQKIGRPMHRVPFNCLAGGLVPMVPTHCKKVAGAELWRAEAVWACAGRRRGRCCGRR